jgi:hypothetical protein
METAPQRVCSDRYKYVNFAWMMFKGVFYLYVKVHVAGECLDDSGRIRQS